MRRTAGGICSDRRCRRATWSARTTHHRLPARAWTTREPYALDPAGDERAPPREATCGASAALGRRGVPNARRRPTRHFGHARVDACASRVRCPAPLYDADAARATATDSRALGSARPFDFFITAPTSTPCSFFSPARKRAASLGILGEHLIHPARPSAPRRPLLTSPSRFGDLRRAGRPSPT